MVLWIVRDVVKRKWLVIALAIVQTSFFMKAVWQIWPAADAWAAPFAVSWFLTIAPGTILQKREVYQLPVSRRALWLARWWLGTGGSVTIATLAMLAAHWQAGSPPPSFEQLALFATFAFLYCGMTLAVQATRFGRAADEPVVPGEILKTSLRLMPRVFAVMFACLAAPFFFVKYLPHSFAAITTPSVLAMLSVAAIAVSGFLYRPPIEGRPSMRMPGRSDTSAAHHNPTAARAKYSDRFTGLRLALWEESAKQLVVFSALIVAVVIGWAVVSQFRSAPTLPKFLQIVAGFPFASHRAQDTEFLTWGALLMFSGMTNNPIQSPFRCLRRLPLSTNQLGCLPVVLGLISSAMLWIVMLALHVLVLGTVPVSPRIDLFLAVAGLTALGHVIRFVAMGHVVAKGMIAFSPIAIIWLAAALFLDSHNWHPEIVQPGMLIGGALLIFASFAVMRRSVIRSNRIYRPSTLMMRFR